MSDARLASGGGNLRRDLRKVGIDGRIPFKPDGKTARFAVVSVKGGKLKADDIRGLIAVASREEATSLGFGVLVTLNTASSGMKADATSPGDI